MWIERNSVETRHGTLNLVGGRILALSFCHVSNFVGLASNRQRACGAEMMSGSGSLF